jgi:hypothetical protein
MEEESETQQKRPPLLQRAKRSCNRWMRQKGWQLHSRQMVFHYVQLVWEQASAMLPITLLQVGPVRERTACHHGPILYSNGLENGLSMLLQSHLQ